MTIKQCGFINVPIETRNICLYGHLRGSVTLTSIAEFGSGDVTTCVKDLGLSRVEFEHQTFRLWGESSNRLRPPQLYTGKFKVWNIKRN